MNFDINRLARLAGLEGQASGQVLTESPDNTDDEMISEIGNQRKRDEQGEEDDSGHQLAESDDEVLEIDEEVLKEEIKKMRQERMAEAKLRSAIRSELTDILGGTGYDQSGSWVYGDNKPTKSKKGQVTMGALGVGFE